MTMVLYLHPSVLEGTEPLKIKTIPVLFKNGNIMELKSALELMGQSNKDDHGPPDNNINEINSHIIELRS